MRSRHITLAISFILILDYSSISLAASRTPRTCNAEHSIVFDQNNIPSGGIGGTGHEPTIPPGGIGGTEHDSSIRTSDAGGIGGTGHEPTIPPGGIGGTEHDSSIRTSDAGGIGGTGHEPTIPPGGIGGTGHDPVVPPGGIGGTGITMAGKLLNLNGTLIAEESGSRNKIKLAVGDEICLGDKIASAPDAKAKIQFADGAALYILKDTEVSIDEYHYQASDPKLSRSQVTLVKGDIRSTSGMISKINPQNYSFKTPLSTIRVIGTDFFITHLPKQEGALDAGTYTKVISGEVSVQSATSTVRLRAGESSHVLLNGTQSIISGGGGSCAP